ncbi:MAG: hypothetical protein ACP5E3_08460 [Bacteroidales bacterium]
MKRILIFISILVCLSPAIIKGQESLNNNQLTNSAQRMLELPDRLTVGGYGQVDYVQKLENGQFNLANLDVHRLVMLFGYKFNSRTSFITEIEYEHVKEVYIEQAFLDYKINRFMNLRTGLVLIPMGFINEYHEPTSFNGTLRPAIDKYIVPTTWREIGIGLTGNILSAGLNYQVYILNGFNGYDGDANLGGSSGFRSGRQKAAESFMSSPNFSAKVSYYGLPSLNIGLSTYYGKSQSSLYNNLDKSDESLVATADSSVVGTLWTGLDIFYRKSGIDLRAQLYHVNISNSDEYNQLAGSDLGSVMLGYYLEAGYNVFQEINGIEQELKPFIRYEMLNNHHKVEENTVKNEAYNRNYIVTGLGWWMTSGAVLKADIQFSKNAAGSDWTKTLNLGMGVRF